MISSRPDAAEREADRWASRLHSRIGRTAQQRPVRVAGNHPAGQRRSLLHLGFASQWRRCAPVVQRAFLLATTAHDPVSALAHRLQRAEPARAGALPDALAPAAASHLRSPPGARRTPRSASRARRSVPAPCPPGVISRRSRTAGSARSPARTRSAPAPRPLPGASGGIRCAPPSAGWAPAWGASPDGIVRVPGMPSRSQPAAPRGVSSLRPARAAGPLPRSAAPPAAGQ
jgi:hypothetical protein